MDEARTFDHQVHKRDPKTGKIVRENNYVVKFSKEGGTIYVRDGVEFYPDGSRVNRPQMPEPTPIRAEVEVPKNPDPAPSVPSEPNVESEIHEASDQNPADDVVPPTDPEGKKVHKSTKGQGK